MLGVRIHRLGRCGGCATGRHVSALVEANGVGAMFEESGITAGDLMTRDVAVVHPDTSLMEAVQLMARRGVSGLPVVDAAGTIVGMLTEGDLVRWHEGYSEKQARWLDMLAEGGDLAPDFLESIRNE